MKTLWIALIAIGLSPLSQAATCRAKCYYSAAQVLKDLNVSSPSSTQLQDFRNYCDSVGGHIWNGQTCSGSYGYQCLAHTAAYPKEGLDLVADGIDSYEATQSLRQSCENEKPSTSCSQYVSEAYLGPISCQ